ncbi:MAG TPA: hypothetical protein VF176_03250 [Solirubrobacterales bacterium]
MLSEFNVLIGGAIGGLVSGVVALALNRRELRRAARLREEGHEELAWEQHQSPELATNLLVLEVVGDEIETSAVDVAVRARLTPTELRSAIDGLREAALIEFPNSNRIKLTEAGRSVLERHKLAFEEVVAQRPRDERQVAQNSEDLDLAIQDAVQTLRARHAH